MERLPSQLKHHDNAESDKAPRPDHDSCREPNHFAGQGIQNSGHLAAGRDVNIIHNGNVLQLREGEDDRERRERERQDRERQDEHRKTIFDTLKFDQMGARQKNIEQAHFQTCSWILQDQAYREWLRDDISRDVGYFLWIKGKPGAGKSTMMKFLLNQAEKQTQRKQRQSTTISFFFNARGNDMEKGTLGLYRSLLVQLLQLYPHLKSVLDGYPKGTQWNVESVRGLFGDTVRLLFDETKTVKDVDRAPVVCFIDALDECEEQQVRDMIAHLSGLCNFGNRLHVCFASRHYPHITTRKGSSIILEDRQGHQQNIASYIDSTLYINEENCLGRIRSDLQKKASGVFMWVVLVVKILNKECDAGRGLEFQLRQRLAEIPADLHTLFQNILTRDTTNAPNLLLCVQ
ncbi:uncharacterized protein PpBr36_09788 [Pyricularia pennisetigena]|uniref:uncharacterized protein n=1 Tax=Pyricularia pennisetigena TaxID=1578925 RepID=UPI001152B613|nr:uncharacterized protein PpBr36_09788 [Pyricularia pennisetigena]TLS22162.1 hypothetical protein PpBr36_09788 [Pyricularia pennisetigena]